MPPSKDFPTPNILRGPGDYEVTSRVHSDTYPGIDPSSLNLSGKAVFITGGSRGLGRAMALSFVKAGVSKIAVGARSGLNDLEHEIEGLCAKVPEFLGIKLDVTDEVSVAAAATIVKERFGQLNVLVNNAGSLGKYALIADSDPETWWGVMNTNLRGPYLVTRAFLPLMLQTQGEKYIVNVCSVAAHLNNPTLSAYQVAKNGLLKLTTLTNAEYASQGVIAFAVHPGNVPTDIMGGPEAIPPHHKHVFVDTPQLSGDSVAFLVSEKREWLGGRYINCVWDLPELMTMEAGIVNGDKLKNKFDFDMGFEV